MGLTYNNLGCYYRKRGKLHSALQMLDKALRLELLREPALHLELGGEGGAELLGVGRCHRFVVAAGCGGSRCVVPSCSCCRCCRRRRTGRSLLIGGYGVPRSGGGALVPRMRMRELLQER